MPKKHITLNINDRVHRKISRLVVKEKGKEYPSFPETNLSALTERLYRQTINQTKNQ